MVTPRNHISIYQNKKDNMMRFLSIPPPMDAAILSGGLLTTQVARDDFASVTIDDITETISGS